VSQDLVDLDEVVPVLAGVRWPELFRHRAHGADGAARCPTIGCS